MTIPSIQPDDTIWYGNTGPGIANAPFQGTYLYSNTTENLLELHNITNTANIEFAITLPDVGQNIYFLNSSVSFAYSSFREILYLYPPDTFFIETDTDTNTDNTIISLENYCCAGTTLIRDNFGNIVDQTPLDRNCHGFMPNDSIWQELSNGRRITARVDKEDCANGALYVSLATGHFEEDRNIYKDNGSLQANVFVVYANLSGKIAFVESAVDLLVEREQFDPIGPTIAIDKYFTESATGAYLISVEVTKTANTIGKITPDLPDGDGHGKRMR